MKHPTDAGFEHDDNTQVVDQGSLLIVGWALSSFQRESRNRNDA